MEHSFLFSLSSISLSLSCLNRTLLPSDVPPLLWMSFAASSEVRLLFCCSSHFYPIFVVQQFAIIIFIFLDGHVFSPYVLLHAFVRDPSRLIFMLSCYFWIGSTLTAIFDLSIQPTYTYVGSTLLFVSFWISLFLHVLFQC
ncbi:hypothetical protein C8Q75DRAFT_761986 [Abortiporus biennis]|nr:hypothetical protein C8Q75DRAFT_761986 [Abortiporus biennis]